MTRDLCTKCHKLLPKFSKFTECMTCRKHKCVTPGCIGTVSNRGQNYCVKCRSNSSVETKMRFLDVP